MFKWILIKLLNRQEKLWHKKLRCVNFEYDCVCLTDEQQKEVLGVKESVPKYIQMISDLRKVLVSGQ